MRKIEGGGLFFFMKGDKLTNLSTSQRLLPQKIIPKGKVRSRQFLGHRRVSL
jgi:hypothetical protein